MDETKLEFEIQNQYVFEKPNSARSDALYMAANEELAIPFPSTPIDTMPFLTKITGGFRANEFTILCGATGSGKTTFLANISDALMTQFVPHFVASVETGPTDFLKRVMSVRLDRDINTGEQVDIAILKHFKEKYGEIFIDRPSLFLSLYDNRCAVEKLMNDIAWHVEKHGVKVAIIDNLNFFMEVTSAQNQIVEMDRVVHELIIFCKRVPVHVVMVMHPKKTDGGRVESEFDVKGSSTAVQEAHNVFLFNRPRKEDIEKNLAGPMARELKIAKMRRRGKAVNSRLIYETTNGVKYTETVAYEF